MLARGSAPEVGADDQNRSPRRLRLVQDKFRSTDVLKQQFTIADAANPSEEPSRNNSVRINIVARDHGNSAGVSGECVHVFRLPGRRSELRHPTSAYNRSSMLVPTKDQFLTQTGGHKPMAVYR